MKTPEMVFFFNTVFFASDVFFLYLGHHSILMAGVQLGFRLRAHKCEGNMRLLEQYGSPQTILVRTVLATG